MQWVAENELTHFIEITLLKTKLHVHAHARLDRLHHGVAPHAYSIELKRNFNVTSRDVGIQRAPITLPQAPRLNVQRWHEHAFLNTVDLHGQTCVPDISFNWYAILDVAFLEQQRWRIPSIILVAINS